MPPHELGNGRADLVGDVVLGVVSFRYGDLGLVWPGLENFSSTSGQETARVGVEPAAAAAAADATPAGSLSK